jgi:hypothetical protein
VLVLAAAGGCGSYLLDRRAKQDPNPLAVSHLLDVVSPNTIVLLLLVVAGVPLTFSSQAGLYLLAGTVLIAIIGGLTSAWLFITAVSG